MQSNGYLSTETIEALKTAYGDLSKVIQYTDFDQNTDRVIEDKLEHAANKNVCI